MSKVRLYGDTSGFVDLKAPDVASNVTITLPNTAGPFATETYVDAAVAAIPEIAGIGSNVVTVTKDDVFSTSSTSFVDVTDLTVTITPTSATSKVLVVATVVSGGSGNIGNYITLADGSNNNLVVPDTPGSRRAAFFAPYSLTVNAMFPSTFAIIHSPATTSAFTYKIQAACENAVYPTKVNQSVYDGNSAAFARAVSTITAIEVAA